MIARRAGHRAALLAALALVACAPPRTIYRPAEAVVAMLRDQPMDVRLVDGSRYRVAGARVADDTLRGTALGYHGSAEVPFVAALGEIAAIAPTRRPVSDRAGQVGLLAGTAVGASLAVLAALALAGMH